MTLSRRGFLKSGGALVVSFAAGSVLSKELFAQNGLARGFPVGQAQAPMSVDSFIAIHEDGSVTVMTSHVDVGTGITTAYRQIAAEELGIPVERFTVIQGNTNAVANTGGTGGSSGVPRGGAEIRRAAATARKALLDRASAQLGVPAAQLAVSDGEVKPSAGGKGVSIASLVGGKHFDVPLDPKAPLKDPATYTIVGKPILRLDVPGKSTGRHVYVQDFRVPEMLHGRVIRPTTFGAKLVSVDESSIKAIPDVQVVRLESFLGVVAKNEWAAVRAARELKAIWSEGLPMPVSEGLDQTMKAAAGGPNQAATTSDSAAYSSAFKQVSATYYWPFQSHASLGPSCVIADVKDSGTKIWSSTQDTYGLRSLLARTFSMPAEQIEVNYMEGSGSYGSNGAYDAAADAVLLSRATRQPVRLQWTRQDELGWDPKGPAQLLEMRSGLDKDGNIVAWEGLALALGGPSWTDTLLGPTSAGLVNAPDRGDGRAVTQNLDTPYAATNVKVSGRALKNTPIRTSNLRAPSKMGNVFASEAFADELAFAAGMDAVAFRRSKLTDPRAHAVIDRVVSMIGWKPRTSPRAERVNVKGGPPVVGRGFSYMRYKQNETYVAMAMEAAVDRSSGKVAIHRVVCAHDCGLIMNPDGLRNQVEGNILQALSRTLHEEVTFDGTRVTSVDWAHYPLLTFPEAPVIEVALIDRIDQPSHGAGEAAGAPVAAALSNAIFDATGVRLRTVPFTAARLKAVFSA